MPDIATLPAHKLADALRRRELSSRELLDHYLDRIERLDPALNAVVTLDPAAPRRAADAAPRADSKHGTVCPSAMPRRCSADSCRRLAARAAAGRTSRTGCLVGR